MVAKDHRELRVYRRYPSHFVSKLSDADAEAAETRVWLDFAHAFGYLSEVDYNHLNDRYNHVCSQLSLMIEEPDKWCSVPRKS